MQMRGVGGTGASPAPGAPLEAAAAVTMSPEQMILAQVQEQLDEQQRASRQARRASMEVQRSAEREQVAQLHRAADFTLYAGIAGALNTGAQAGGQAMGAAGRGGQGGGGQGAGGGQAGRSYSAGSPEAQAFQAWFQSEAKHSDAAAAAGQHRAGRAGEQAREHGEDAERALRMEERALQHVDQVLQAQRQAEQAATRA
jgi:hypothetical protein